MLNVSFATVMMAVITTNILLIMLTLLLCETKLMIGTGYRLLALFTCFVLLRCALPLEFPFTQNVHLPYELSRLLAAFYSGQLFLWGETPVTPWLIFRWVWAAGIVVGLLLYVWSYFRARNYIILYGKVITPQEPYAHYLDDICRKHGGHNCFTVVELPGLRVPALFGIFKPHILIPENFNMREDVIKHVLQHETSHHFHHDLILKSFIRLITLIYWWNPFCILLNYQADIIIEMRIDAHLTMMDDDSIADYLECLIAVAQLSSSRSPLPRSCTMSLLTIGHSNVWKRFHLLSAKETKNRRPVRTALGLVLVSCFLFSYVFILESYCQPTDEIPLTTVSEENLIIPSAANIYYLDNEDGTYDIYYNNIHIDTTDSLEYYSQAVPIYTKDNCPE